MTRVFAALPVALALIFSAACSDGPLRLETIQLGRSLNVDNSVGSLATTFKPSDTIYVSVLTSNRGSGTVGVRWMYGSQLVSEREKVATFQGPGATEFHIQSAGGFPTGSYTVELFLDGASVGTRNFTVVR